MPANTNALAVARSMKISSNVLRMVFGEHAEAAPVSRTGKDIVQLSASMPKLEQKAGEHAKTKSLSGTTSMLLSQRIQAAEKGVLAMQDQLDRHIESIDDDNPSEEQMVLTEDLTAKLEAKQRHLTSLKAIEAKNGAGAEGDPTQLAKRSDIRMPANITVRPKKKLEPLDYFFRAAAVKALSRCNGHDIDVIRRRAYGDDEATKAVFDLVLKASTAPAETTVAGWAQELVHTLWADFMQVLLPMSVFPRLSAKGLALTFGRNGKIIIPTRNLTPSIGGSFVGEGLPIPVRQGAFASQTLTPKKMAVISTWTRELDEHSLPAIEGLLRQAILEDTAIALDTILLDNNPATTIRPPGLRSF